MDPNTKAKRHGGRKLGLTTIAAAAVLMATFAVAPTLAGPAGSVSDGSYDAVEQTRMTLFSDTGRDGSYDAVERIRSGLDLPSGD